MLMVHDEVALLALNTVALSFVWTYNVSGVTFATLWGRLLFAVSTMFGTISGIYLLELFNIK
jgi:hypothetical protein